jgi:gliding motility-associated-like protein
MQSIAGCGSSLSVTLQHTNLSVAHGFLNEVCFGDTTGLAYVTTTGATPPINYAWYNIAAPTTIISSNDSIVNMPAGTYYCHVYTPGGCVGYDTVTISQPALTADTAGTHTLFCPLDTNLTITAMVGMLQYQWYGPSGLIPGGTSVSLVVPHPIVNQVYYCNMRPAVGCPTTYSDTLLYYNQHSTANAVPIGAYNISCYGNNDGTAYVSSAGGAPGPFSYAWSNISGGSTISTNDSLLNAYAGTYVVTVTSQGGCHTMDTVNLTQPFNPGDSVHLTTTFCLEDKNIVLRVQPGLGTYAWYFGNADTTGIVLGHADTLLIPDPVAGTYYTVLVTPAAGFGCPYLITSALNYAPPPNLPDYMVSSNAFSPDGNDQNDKFDVSLSPTTHKTFAHTKDFHVEIYNRWGKKVFESDDVNNQWDGKINGKPADEGVYYWMASFTSLCTPNGETHESNGFVQIFRKP